MMDEENTLKYWDMAGKLPIKERQFNFDDKGIVMILI